MLAEPEKAEVYSMLKFAFKENLEGVELRAINQYVYDTARKNDKRPAKLEMFVDDSWVQSLRGNTLLQDVFVMVRIPRETLDAYLNKLRGGDRKRSDHQDLGAPQSAEPDDPASPAISDPLLVDTGD